MEFIIWKCKFFQQRTIDSFFSSEIESGKLLLKELQFCRFNYLTLD